MPHPSARPHGHNVARTAAVKHGIGVQVPPQNHPNTRLHMIRNLVQSLMSFGCSRADHRLLNIHNGRSVERHQFEDSVAPSDPPALARRKRRRPSTSWPYPQRDRDARENGRRWQAKSAVAQELFITSSPSAELAARRMQQPRSIPAARLSLNSAAADESFRSSRHRWPLCRHGSRDRHQAARQ